MRLPIVVSNNLDLDIAIALQTHYIHSNVVNKMEGAKLSILWKIRILASQCLATLPLNILQFTCGSFAGLTSVLAFQQQEIEMNLNETNLIVNYCYTQPIGYIVGGVLAQIFGTRKIIMTSDIIFICSWLLLRSSSSILMLMCAQSIVGMTVGMIEGPSYAYLAEITEPRFRNTLMAALNLPFLMGTLVFVLMTEIMHWRDVTLIYVVFPIIGLSLMCLVPESPYWLANRNRYDKVGKSLSWFRGWKLSADVKADSFLIINNAKKSPEMLKLVCQRSFYIPMTVVIFTMLVDSAGGSQILLIHFKSVMKELKFPIDQSMTLTTIAIGRIVCAIICILIIHVVGKRLLILISLVIASVSFISASIFEFFIVNGYLTCKPFVWAPAIALLISTLLLTAGIGNGNSELLPSKLRQISTGIGFSVRDMLLIIFQTNFVQLFNNITGPGIFLMFAVVNIIGYITLYYVLPETGNRSLIEIEELYFGMKKNKEKSIEMKQST